MYGVVQINILKETEKLFISISEDYTGDCEDIGIESLIKNQKQIDYISDYCKTFELYQYCKDKRDEFSEGLDAIECLGQMIGKIKESPNRLFIVAAIILIMPVISDKLKDYS